MIATNILVSSAGRRVGLLGCFRDALARRGAEGAVLTVDSGSSAPASFHADQSFRVPQCSDTGFVDAVLDLCQEHHVNLLIPTIDPELPVYAASRARLAEHGVKTCISDPSTIEICRNKMTTHAWLLANGFPTVQQTDPETALADASEWPLPLIVKPYNGSGSGGVRVLRTRREFEGLAEIGSGYIVQEVAQGREFTVNAYVSESGDCVCAVPHWRREVRAGEVSKGITVKDRRLIDLARAVTEALPGAYGPLNLQCFLDDSGAIRIIEMNARFGGGYPLAHHARALFTDWLLDELEGKKLAYFDGWTDDVAMLRYDEAVFVSGSLL